MRDLETCEICHEEFDPEELIEFGGVQLCSDCLDSSTIVCDRCGAANPTRMPELFCLSDEELKQMSWTTFVAGCTQHPELVLYLKERRLFVNDPVETEAEV